MSHVTDTEKSVPFNTINLSVSSTYALPLKVIAYKKLYGRNLFGGIKSAYTYILPNAIVSF